MNIFAAKLSFDTQSDDLRETFEAFGEVTSANVITDKLTGRSKGFGFVEMGSDAEAQAAIKGMNGQNMGGRDLVVNEARPMEPRPPRSGGGGGYGGGGGGGGYGGGRSGGGGGYGGGGGGGYGGGRSGGY